jgi:hypothetical protein
MRFSSFRGSIAGVSSQRNAVVMLERNTKKMFAGTTLQSVAELSKSDTQTRYSRGIVEGLLGQVLW